MKISRHLFLFALLLGTAFTCISTKAQNITGTITCQGTGIANVVVSDGYEVTTTNASGYYALTSQKVNGYVFYSVPSGYQPEVTSSMSSYRKVFPPIYQQLTSNNTSVAEVHNFTLTLVNNNTHIMVVGTDSHLAGQYSDKAQFQVGYINRLKEEAVNAGTTPIYSTILGDMSWDAYWYKNSMTPDKVRDIFVNDGYPFTLYPVMGNHDNNGATTADANTDFNAAASWRTNIAPNYYSYNIGKIHYVVLDDIYYKNEDTGSSYNTGIVGSRNYDNYIQDYELDWLKKDLAYVNKSTPVIVTMHIQAWQLSTTSPFAVSAYLTGRSTNSTTKLCDILKDYTTVHIFTGHTHYNYHAFPSAYTNVHENNIAAICATWWKSGYYSNRHICRDGSPGGYELYKMDGTNISWQYHSIENNGNAQFRVYDMNKVSEFYKNSSALQKLLTYNNSLSSPFPLTDFSSYTANSLLVNIFNYDPQWTIKATEGGKSLTVTRVATSDPFHVITYDLPYYNANSSLNDATTKNSHMFKIQSSTATGTIELTVKDRFGNIYTKEVTRPIDFNVNMVDENDTEDYSSATIPNPIVNIGFNADGIVNTGTETHNCAAYNTANVSQLLDPQTGRYIGSTSNNTESYYYVNYDADDKLGQAFAKKCSYEILVRLDKSEGMNYSSGEDISSGTIKFFSGQQTGGWSLSHYPHTGLKFEYVGYKVNNSTQTTDALVPNVMLQTGKFYHLVITTDETSKMMKLYVNGQLVGSQALSSATFKYPQIGTTTASKGMWFNLGGDPGSTLGHCEQSAQTSWIFAKVYGKVLSADQVTKLYEGSEVQHYANASLPTDNKVLLDAVFSKDTVSDASGYRTLYRPLKRVGSLTTQYNTTQGRYESVWNANSSNYIQRDYFFEPSFTSSMSDAFSIECYAKNTDATWTEGYRSPISLQQGGGIGIEMQNTGKTAFNCNTYGDQTGFMTGYDGQGRGTRHSLGTYPKTMNTSYNHYVFIYDRVGTQPTTKIYLNGVLVQKDTAITITPTINSVTQSSISVLMNNSECIAFSYAPWQWVGIGGDAKANRGGYGNICDFPFSGNISIARIFAKALSDDEISALYAEAAATNPSYTVTVGETGFASLCLPFVAKVPAGVTAYVVRRQDANTVYLDKYAQAGEAIASTTPVILKLNDGSAVGNYVFTTADKATADKALPIEDNLLEGTLIPTDVTANSIYCLAANGTNAEMRLTTALTVPKYKAYLPNTDVETTGSSKKFILGYNGPTVIRNINIKKMLPNTYYDLQGRTVLNPAHGIFIQNGKKVWVR